MRPKKRKLMSIRPKAPIAKSPSGELIYQEPIWVELPVNKPQIEEILEIEFQSSTLSDFVVESSVFTSIPDISLDEFVAFYIENDSN